MCGCVWVVKIAWWSAGLFDFLSVGAVEFLVMASGKVMDPENLNLNVKKTVYAVRGELYLRASELQKEGKKVDCISG